VPSLSVTPTTVAETTSTTTPTTTVPTILDGSGGVEVEPNVAVVLMNGVTQDMQVSIAQGFVATAQIPGLFTVRLAPQFLATDPVIAGSDSEIRVFKGRTIQMSAEGFVPQSEVQVWVNSTPFLQRLKWAITY
jgi:hypothetical protein